LNFPPVNRRPDFFQKLLGNGVRRFYHADTFGHEGGRRGSVSVGLELVRAYRIEGHGRAIARLGAEEDSHGY